MRKEARAVFYQIDSDSSRKILPCELATRLSDFGKDDRAIEALLCKLDENADGYISLKEFTNQYPEYQKLTGESVHRLLTLRCRPPAAAAGQHLSETSGWSGDSAGQIFHALCDDEQAAVDFLEAQKAAAIGHAAEMAIALSEAQLANDSEKLEELSVAIEAEKVKAIEMKGKVAGAEAALIESVARLRREAWAEVCPHRGFLVCHCCISHWSCISLVVRHWLCVLYFASSQEKRVAMSG